MPPKYQRSGLDYYELLLARILAVVLEADVPLSCHRIAKMVGRKKGDEFMRRIIKVLSEYHIVKEVKKKRRTKFSPTSLCFWLYLYAHSESRHSTDDVLEKRACILKRIRRPEFKPELENITAVFDHIEKLNSSIKEQLLEIAWSRLIEAARWAFGMPGQLARHLTCQAFGMPVVLLLYQILPKDNAAPKDIKDFTEKIEELANDIMKKYDVKIKDITEQIGRPLKYEEEAREIIISCMLRVLLNQAKDIARAYFFVTPEEIRLNLTPESDTWFAFLASDEELLRYLCDALKHVSRYFMLNPRFISYLRRYCDPGILYRVIAGVADPP